MTSERADEVTLLESLPLTEAHVEVERYAEDIVALTIDAPALTVVEVALLMSTKEARRLGSLLFHGGD